MIDLWTEASRDAEAELREQRFTAARLAVVPLWSFLAAAQDPTDYENRKAIVADRIDDACQRLATGAEFAVLRNEVEAAFDRDFDVLNESRLVQEAKRRVAARKEAERKKAEYLPETTHSSDTPEGSEHVGPKESCPICTSGGQGEDVITTGEVGQMAKRKTAVDNTPYGVGGDHCPFCGADWKEEHDPGCERIVNPANATAIEEEAMRSELGMEPTGRGWTGSRGRRPFVFRAEQHGGYHLEQDGGRWKVVNHIGEVKSTFDSKEEALNYQRALMVNVPGAQESAERHERNDDKAKHSSKTAGSYYCRECKRQVETQLGHEWGHAKDCAKGDGPQDQRNRPLYPKKAADDDMPAVDPAADTSHEGERIKTLRDIVQNSQAQKIDGMLVDLVTANMLTQIHDALSPENQAKFDDIPLQKLVDWGWSRTKAASKTAAEDEDKDDSEDEDEEQSEGGDDSGSDSEDDSEDEASDETESASGSSDSSEDSTEEKDDSDSKPPWLNKDDDKKESRRQAAYGDANEYDEQSWRTDQSGGYAGRCAACGDYADYYIMGPGAGDWADYYCERHLEQGKRVLGPNAIVEDLGTTATAMRKGAPFADYTDFDDCVSKNSDKDDPEAYCGKIKHETEDKKAARLADITRVYRQAGFEGEDLRRAVAYHLEGA